MYKNKELRHFVLLETAVILLFAVCGFIFYGIPASGLIILSGVLLFGIFWYHTRKRYQALEELNDYLTKVLAGNEVPKPEDQEEGELSILKTNIYKATTMLQYQKKLLSEDKLRLATAIADISHQLKTPLTSMMVMNDLLKTEEDPEKRLTFLSTQSGQLNRMNWLIQTLLKLSKLDAGTIELKKEEVAVKELIKDTLKPFEIQMELKNIQIDVSIQEKSIRCDKNWTIEAIQNIIKNCYEHMEQGGLLKIAVTDTNLFWQISISDTGCGIDKGDLPHIFERFYKGKNAGKDSVGIGLALAKTIMEGQKGDILVESRKGEGTKFDIRIYKTII